MAFDCVKCGKSTTADDAVFCVYCGEKLSDPNATQAFSSSESSRETVVDNAVPLQVGGYRIVKRLGEGGMGTVYEAEAEDSGKRVAVKLLSNKLASNPTSVERFRQEGRLASQISHPRCVFVYHADADSGRPFIVMELMPGETLKDLVDRKGHLTPREAILRILDIIDGLIEAHRLGLIHRDVKPSNCFVTADDRVKIGDFGLSKSLIESGADGSLTGTGAFLGTVLYAPPEQIRGEEVSFDSDVYSVCATLYYLLTGRAPYQHESMTAALAKAISEPPPPLRQFRPDVPKALDRAVLKGLERDRTRRFDSLEELRDTLQAMLPDQQVPARTRMLIAAYGIDVILTFFLVQVPIELLEWALGLRRWLFSGEMAFDPLTWLGYGLYFAVCEGFLGATVGKWLLGLRVVPRGSVGPPGFGRATLRAAVFLIGWMVIYAGLLCIAELPQIGVPLGVVMILLGIGYLAFRHRTFDSNRGLHDLASGCHVVQTPRRPHRVKLVSHGPNRLERVVPVKGLPASLGGYFVHGKLAETRDGSQVWLADDRSLGRRIFLHAKPNAEESQAPTRPTRLRLLSRGTLDWRDRAWTWNAYAAPAGAPLADMVPLKSTLNWPDARLLLEQIVEELRHAEADDSLPDPVSVNHLWCEPMGRVVLLDFPMPSTLKVTAVEEPADLIRQAATLMLEGTPRVEGDPIRAPLPPQATAIVNRLFDERNAYANLGELQTELGDSHAHEPKVNGKMRATQLGIAALIAMLPVLMMFLFTQFANFNATLQHANMQAYAAAIRQKCDDSETRENWQQSEALRETMEDYGAFRRGLDGIEADECASFDTAAAELSRPERFVAMKYRAMLETSKPKFRIQAQEVAEFTKNAEESRTRNWRRFAFRSGAALCGIVLVIFAVFAFIFRGGLSFPLSGIALVQRDGRRAGRIRCVAREIVLWLPLIVAFVAASWIQTAVPQYFALRLISGGLVMLVLMTYLAIGLRSPEQGPHDRLLGTWRMPA